MEFVINSDLDILVVPGSVARAREEGEDNLSLFIMPNGDVVATDDYLPEARAFLGLIELSSVEEGCYEEYSPS